MGGFMNEKNGILQFSLFKVEKGKEKICKCDPPHYEIDTANRIITCGGCGAVIDPFDAIARLAEYTKEYEEYQDRALEKINSYREMANEELRRRFRNRAFKEMDSQYRSGMLPRCPKCQEIFDPIEIDCWTNQKYYKESESENE